MRQLPEFSPAYTADQKDSKPPANESMTPIIDLYWAIVLEETYTDV